MNVVSLFSGIGGLDLGVKFAVPDARVVAYVERDSFCQSILRRRIADRWLDDAPIFDDVRTFPPAGWDERIDLIIGGWPCQPFSLAGKRAGTIDERHLWPEVARIVGLCRPRYVFGENVPGFISLGLGECLVDLAALGFDAEWTTVRASDVGAPHRRERVFILAHAQRPEWRAWDSDRCGDGWCHDDLEGAQSPDRTTPYRRVLADADDAGPQGRASERGIADERAARTSSAPMADAHSNGRPFEWAGDRDHLDGYGAAWTFPPGPADLEGWRALLEREPDLAPATPIKPAVRRGVDGIAKRVDRLRALGNAVVPLQAAVAFRTLWARLDE